MKRNKHRTVGTFERNLTFYFKFILFRFSAEGTPFYVDSKGIVYMLNRNFGNTWLQVANTRKHVRSVFLLNFNDMSFECSSQFGFT